MTTTPADALRDALAGLGAPAALERDELLAMVTVLGDAQAVLDAVKVQVAGELVRRSTLLGHDNPVSRAGHTSPADLLAERWQIPMPAARQFCQVGDATSVRASLLGEALPPEFSALSDAVVAPFAPGSSGSGRVSVDQAAVIVRELRKASHGCSVNDLQGGERLLVEHAPNLSVTDLRSLAAQVRDCLDQDGVVPREHRQRQRRSLTVSTTSDGMTHVDWYLEPESAGFVVTAIDALVGHTLRSDRTVRFAETPSVDSGDGDQHHRYDDGFGGLPQPRTLAQLRSDAALHVFRHFAASPTAAAVGDSAAAGRAMSGDTIEGGSNSLSRDSTPVAGKPPVTVIVRIALDALRSGVGVGEIDGIRSPISAGAVRRMAADAAIIPVVLGSDSEVLDLGRSRRLFSTAQKRALAERDGGCAWSGCPHPPSYTQAHHIRWWSAHGGETDLDNGILLCSRHHHQVHDDGWDIEVREHVPYFIPPDHVDPYRRPRRGGRVRLGQVA